MTATATTPLASTATSGANTAHKELVQRLAQAIETCFRTGDTGPLDEVLSPNLVNHIPGMPGDREGLKQALAGFRAAFPDLTVTVEEVLSCGDRVVDRLTWSATHTGPMMGIPASGKRVTVGEMHIGRVENGKFVERWGHWDALGMMQQIGAVPGPQ
jgi:predicted ester cyclase